ncbi:MAG: TIGR04282 family arsenosugar biosynthesis glycosyltransferase [Nitrospiraceae bacterium]|nr:MAG: TIGR04282 family arsenosugar biosynthesis glycosyltransferase [Nitrospiraceae bacterium]
MKQALITFVKAPVPGKVKTRLQAGTGPEKAAALYRTFVKELTGKCSRLRGVDRFLGCTPSPGHPFLRDIAAACGMKTFTQRGTTLGERIFNAFRHCAKRGYSEMVLIGSDSPSLPLSFIRKAFSVLRTHDLVIGPCFDQGLYLIGVRREKIRELSRHIPIDTGRDVQGILEVMHARDKPLHVLPFWYDIDDVNDLEFLRLHLRHLKNPLLL